MPRAIPKAGAKALAISLAEKTGIHRVLARISI
jgi:hypothetical protein